MNKDETLDFNIGGNDLILSSQAKGFLSEAAKWAKFIAIVNFIFIGFMVIAALSAGILIPTMSNEFGGAATALGSSFVVIIYLVLAGLWFLPNFFLFRFAARTKTALTSNNTQTLTEALNSIKSHYMISGIFYIIILAFYIILFIVAISGAI